MLARQDFEKKQILIVHADDGERISFSNDNVVVKDSSGKVKIQCTCYRLFVIYVIGNCSLTTVVILNIPRYKYH